MGDAAPSFTAPTNFHPLAREVAASGAPQSSWLAQDLVLRDRWLLKHLRCGFGVPLHDSVVTQINGGIAGPYDVIGTASAETAAWYLLATIANAKVARVVSSVVEPMRLPPHRAYDRWGLDCTGDAAPHLYGPIEAPHAPGPSRVALAIYPEIGAGAATDNGTIYSAEGDTLRTLAIGGISRGWAIQITDAGGIPQSDWMEVTHVWELSVSYEIGLCPPLASGAVFRDAEKALWRAKTPDGSVTCHALFWGEVPT